MVTMSAVGAVFSNFENDKNFFIRILLSVICKQSSYCEDSGAHVPALASRRKADEKSPRNRNLSKSMDVHGFSEITIEKRGLSCYFRFLILFKDMARKNIFDLLDFRC